jgi:hypothetical protein
MARLIRCDCGFEATGDTDEEFVANAQSHAREAHGQDLTADVVLGLTRERRRSPTTDDGEAGRR